MTRSGWNFLYKAQMHAWVRWSRLYILYVDACAMRSYKYLLHVLSDYYTSYWTSGLDLDCLSLWTQSSFEFGELICCDSFFCRDNLFYAFHFGNLHNWRWHGWSVRWTALRQKRVIRRFYSHSASACARCRTWGWLLNYHILCKNPSSWQ